MNYFAKREIPELSKKDYQFIRQALHEACFETVDEELGIAYDLLRMLTKAQMDDQYNESTDHDETIERKRWRVTYDTSWCNRGYCARHGISILIDEETGVVLGIHHTSKDDDASAFAAQHPRITSNWKSSSGNMDAHGLEMSVRAFEERRTKHSLWRCGYEDECTIFTDGDSTAPSVINLHTLCSQAVCGPHAQKNVGSFIDKGLLKKGKCNCPVKKTAAGKEYANKQRVCTRISKATSASIKSNVYYNLLESWRRQRTKRFYMFGAVSEEDEGDNANALADGQPAKLELKEVQKTAEERREEARKWFTYVSRHLLLHYLPHQCSIECAAQQEECKSKGAEVKCTCKQAETHAHVVPTFKEDDEDCSLGEEEDRWNLLDVTACARHDPVVEEESVCTMRDPLSGELMQGKCWKYTEYVTDSSKTFSCPHQHKLIGDYIEAQIVKKWDVLCPPQGGPGHVNKNESMNSIIRLVAPKGQR